MHKTCILVIIIHIYIEKSNLIIQYQGEKIFDVTNNKPYTITITNVDNKPAKFEAQVVDK